MSSAPSGLDVHEYTYGAFAQTIAGTRCKVGARKAWWVTKIQLYAAAGTAARLSLFFSNFDENFALIVQPGGCLVLEPNGAHKGAIEADGTGAVLIVEYWFQSLTGQASFRQQLPLDVENA